MSSQAPDGGEQARQLFVSISGAGPHRDFSKDTRQQPYWDEHAEFIDRLVDEGFILMGGPLLDEGGAMLIVQARDEADARERLEDDPWYREGVLRLESVRRWQIFIDKRT
ncbi:MAG TPA: YciI family protein [Ktedonobacterales bacterium]|nr:YciI family protein [Ktedonobacterales bacterium]